MLLPKTDLWVVTVMPPSTRRFNSPSRLLARDLGVSSPSVIETWRKWDLQPWRRQSFKFSTDPQLEAKLTDIVGLYLNPPENAVVVRVDEKSQVQAVDRTPAGPAVPAARPPRRRPVPCTGRGQAGRRHHHSAIAA